MTTTPPPTHVADPAVRPAPHCTAVVGLQWGDEGKGKIVDLLTAEHDLVVRYNGGANAGHSVVVAGQRTSLHLVPAGVLHHGKLAVIANGVVVDPFKLIEELDGLEARAVNTSGVRLSDRAHLVLPHHKDEDAALEALLTRSSAGAPESSRAIGTTGRGIGPAYADKALRSTALRAGDLLRPALLRSRLEHIAQVKNRSLRGLNPEAPVLDPAALADRLLTVGERLAPHICDTFLLVNDAIDRGRRALFEGANGALLDVDHGAYPFVTSSTTCAFGVGAGAGVPPQRLGSILGVVKAYSTRVGGGPMPTELLDATGERIRQRGREFGTTTGRPRRCGWLDLVALRYAARLNGCTGLAIMLLDVLGGFEKLNVCTAYIIDGKRTEHFPPDADTLERARPVYEALPGFSEDLGAARSRADLPKAAREYLRRIESTVGVPIEIVSVGPDRAQTIRD